MSYPLNDNLLERLIQRSIGCSLASYLDKTREVDSTNKPTFGIVINFAKCNLFCKHCFMNAVPTSKDLPIGAIKKIKRIAQSFDYEVFRPYFTEMYNGDLERHQHIMKLIGYERRHTNGELLADIENPDELYTTVNKLKSEEGIGISVHGFGKHHDYLVGKEGHGDKLVNLIKRLVLLGMRVRVNSCFTALNYRDVEAWGTFLQQIGVSCLVVDRISFTGRAMKKCRDILPTRGQIREMVKGIFRLRNAFAKNQFRVILGVHFGPNLWSSSYYKLHLRSTPYHDGRESYGGSTFCTTIQEHEDTFKAMAAYPIKDDLMKIVPCITFPQYKISFGYIDINQNCFILNKEDISRFKRAISTRPTSGDCVNCAGWEICRGGCRAAAYGQSIAEGKPDLGRGFQHCFTHIVFELLKGGDPDIPANLWPGS